MEEIHFFHPMNEDMEYAGWKQRAAHNKLKPEEKYGFFEKQMGK